MDIVPQTEFTVSREGDTETHRMLGAAGAANVFLDRHPELTEGDVLTVQGLDQPWTHEFTVCRHRSDRDLLVTRESGMVAKGVGEHSVKLLHDDIYQVRRGAWTYHKYDRDGFKRTVSLDDHVVCRILGRSLHRRNEVYTAGYDGHIECGRRQVWATGGRELIEWALAHTTEHDLALRDYVERCMWVSSSTDLLVCHGRYYPDHAPSGAWRRGSLLPEDQYRAMLQQVDHDGWLAYSEARLSDLAQEAGYG